MKAFKYLILSTIIFSTPLASCSDDDGFVDVLWTDIVSVKNLDNDDFSFMTDNGKLLYIENSEKIGYKPKNKRALINYIIINEATEKESYNIKLNWAREITTKDIIAIKPAQEDSIGNDPVEIVSIWEGGDYININFRYATNGTIAHMINLVSPEDKITIKNDTIDLEFRHNAYNDQPHYKVSGVGSFDLTPIKEIVANKETITLRVKTNENREKYYNIKYAIK